MGQNETYQVMKPVFAQQSYTVEPPFNFLNFRFYLI